MQFAARRGAAVDLLVHDTERRVPSELVAQLRASGVHIHRVAHPDELPMHAKFLLVDRGKRAIAWLGSHNFNRRSLLHNAELLVRTEDKSVIDALSQRFQTISEMALD